MGHGRDRAPNEPVTALATTVPTQAPTARQEHAEGGDFRLVVDKVWTVRGDVRTLGVAFVGTSVFITAECRRTTRTRTSSTLCPRSAVDRAPSAQQEEE